MGKARKQPSISVITPVYNAASYLADCIESVLAQTCVDFEYVIADNCSTDDSLVIARRYADTDERVRIVEADEHVGPIQNWNRSLAYAQKGVRYIKFVHADDWLYPECLERMTALADRDDRVAIVSAYRLEEDRISLDRLPAVCRARPMERELILEGREVGRAIFLEYASVLGSPTSLLFRASAMGTPGEFFDESLLHADKDACIRLLAAHRFGFVREVLTYTRRHNESVTSLTKALDTRRQDDLNILVRHGHTFLDENERQNALHNFERMYYAFLARSLVLGREKAFWQSHRQTFERAGLPYRSWRIAIALARQLFNPLAFYRGLRENRIQSGNVSIGSADRFLRASRRPRESDS